MKKKLYTAAPRVFSFGDFILVMIIGVSGVMVQNTIIPWLGLAGYGPEWVLILALYVALRAELWMAVLSAFILGFFRDSLGGGFLGLSQLSLVALIWTFYLFRGRFNFFNPLALMPLLFGLNMANCVFLAMPIMAVLGWSVDDFNFMPLFVISSLTTAILGVPVFHFLTRLTSHKEKS